jgi:2-dehydro-3-deoxyphosphooctonate aldolase (KDO 8-P synthase)
MNLAGLEVGLDRPLFLIAGPCVIESEALVQEVAGRLKEITTALGMPLIFKASFDKANRSSGKSFRGHGLQAGLKALQSVQRAFALPVLTDVHEDTPIGEVAAVVDVLQTPAFLCRQTNFIISVAAAGRPGEYQERPVPVALGDAARRGDKALLDRQCADHGL